MKPAFEDMNLQIPAATAEPEDYTGEDGLLYCGKCRTPKEAYFPADKVALFGRDRHPAECDCQRAQRMEREAAEQQRKHRDKVEELKRRGFTDPAMREWTFANDNGRNPQMKTARFYVEHWEDMKAGNIGYLLWGSVGTGKSYLAGCIANALMEKEISVRMTNFALTMIALNIVIFVIVYGRMIEIYLLTSLAPIPFATVPNRETGHMGQNYFRSLFAVGFQGLLILVCVAIYAVLIQSIATDGDPIGAIWGCVGYTVLLCFTLFKTGSLAKSIFGCH